MGNFLTSCKLGSFSRRTLLHGVSKYVRTVNTVWRRTRSRRRRSRRRRRRGKEE